MEVKDFEGVVKMQGVMMDKLATSRWPIILTYVFSTSLRTSHKDKEGKEKKMTETQRAMLEAKIMQVISALV